MSRTQANISELLDIMQKLRDPKTGCPWDIKQNFSSIAPYTIEEAYEVADAIARNHLSDLREELGDLLLQVVFHAQMAQEQRLFDFHDVVSVLCEKLVRRHPHVFADAEASSEEQVNSIWASEKDKERIAKGEAGPDYLLHRVTRALPSLMRAQKIQKKAAGAGFDWPDTVGVMAKITEELAELEGAAKDQDPAAIEEEMGDLLFAVVNLARHLSVDAEVALSKANDKFIKRFTRVEEILREEGRRLEFSGLDEMQRLWETAKAQEKSH